MGRLKPRHALIALGGYGLLLGTWMTLVAVEAPTYRAQMREMSKEEGRYDLIERDGYWYQRNELQLAGMEVLTGPDADRGERVDPLYGAPVEAIADFSERLAARGIELIVVPVPVRPWVDAPHLSDTPWYTPGVAAGAPFTAFIKELEGRDVQVLDLLPRFQEGARLHREAWVRKSDAHWTNEGVVATARMLAHRIRGHKGLEDAVPITTKATWKPVERAAGVGAFALVRPEERERYPIRSISRLEKGKTVPLEAEVFDSPVVVIGDSHVHWYGGLQGDIGRQLAHELGMEIDTLTLSAGGASRAREELVRRDWVEPGYLDKKKVVVWVWWTVSIRNSDWRITPLEAFPPTRLSGQDRLPAIPTDQVLIRNGVGKVPLDGRWRLPGDLSPDKARDAIWLRKREGGSITFLGASRSAILTIETAGKAEQRVQIYLDGEPIRVLRLPERSSMRYRVNLPEMEEGKHKLFFKMLPRRAGGKPDVMVFGLRDLVITRDQRSFIAGFETLPPGSIGLKRASKRYATRAVDGASTLTVPLSSEATPGIVRFRLQPKTQQDHLVALSLGETSLATDLPLRPGRWTEFAIPVKGWEEGGTNLLHLQTTTETGQPGGVVLDMIELDAG